MNSLLPSNSTKLEKDLESVMVQDVDVDLLKGFKFKGGTLNLNLALIWEYSLADINIDDIGRRIFECMLFHRLKGTAKALRTALSWYGFKDINVEEELVGEHFAEFQIGLEEIPN